MFNEYSKNVQNKYIQLCIHINTGDQKPNWIALPLRQSTNVSNSESSNKSACSVFVSLITCFSVGSSYLQMEKFHAIKVAFIYVEAIRTSDVWMFV